MRGGIQSSLFVFLLLVIATNAFEVPDDCLVSKRIVEDDILFDTFEFLALMTEKGNIKARISCHDKTEYYFNWNSTTVSAPSDTIGWIRLVLRVGGRISLFDDRNQTLLSVDPPLDGSVVSRIELTGSKFTRKCSSGSPVWKVAAEAVDIPLRVNATTSKTISLFSLTPFSPVLGIGGSETHLKMNGDQMVANGDDYDPLSAVTDYRLEFGVSEESGSTVFQVFHLGKFKSPLYILNLPEVPKEMHVRSEDKAKFVLVQYLNPERETRTQSITGMGITNQDYQTKQGLFIGVIAIMGLVILVLSAVLFFQRRSGYCGKTTERPKPQDLNKSRESSSGDAPYLEPDPIRPPQARPPRAFLPTPTSQNSSSLSEHLYEEVDDIVPHHYVNSSETSSSSNDESIPQVV